MANLPSAFDVTAPRSASAATAQADVSGLARGLSNIGQAISLHDKAQDALADKRAAEIEVEVLQSYEPARKEREAGYTGEQVGYSASEISAYDEAVKPFRARPDLDARTQRLVNKRLDDRRFVVSSSAIQFEAAKRGGLESERRAALDAAGDAKVGIAIAKATSDAVNGVTRAWDGKSAGLVDNSLKAFDDAVAPIMSGLPEAQRLRLQSRVLAQRNALFADRMAKEDVGRNADLISTANEALSEATNLVTLYPDQIDNSRDLLMQAAAFLPESAQAGFIKEGENSLIMARWSSLAAQGKIDQIKTELPSYTDKLEKGDFARVQSLIRTEEARKKATDYVAQAALDDRMAAYLDGVVAGDDRGERPTDAEIADIAGEKGLVEFRRKEQAAKLVKSEIADIGSLSPAEQAARQAELEARVAKGGEGYQINVDILNAWNKARVTQAKALTEDPAGWAMTGNGQASDPATPVKHFWNVAMSASDAQTRRAALSTYVMATDARQKEAGIANPSLLPADKAAEWLKSYNDAPLEQKSQALIGLKGAVDDFGPHRGRVLRDLKKAGLGDEDFVALGEMGHPLQLTAYAQGGEGYKALKPKAKDQLETKIAKEMSLFDRTVWGAGAQLNGARRSALARTVMGYMGQGDDEAVAIRKAVQGYKDQYSFNGTWRAPKALETERPTGYSVGKVAAGQSRNTKIEAIRHATVSVKNRFVNTPGAFSDNLADDADRRRLVAQQGQWKTLPDESGLVLMVPDPIVGSWAVVRDKTGAPIQGTFGDLEAKGQADYAAGRR